MSWLRNMFRRKQKEQPSFGKDTCPKQAASPHKSTPVTRGFLAGLTVEDKALASDLHVNVYQNVLKEKRGHRPQWADVYFSTPGKSIERVQEVLRQLAVEDIERLMRSVELGTQASEIGRIDPQHAAELYRSALEHNPYNAIATMSYGICLAQMGRLKQGIEWVEKAAQLDPANDRIRRNLAKMRADL